MGKQAENRQVRNAQNNKRRERFDVLTTIVVSHYNSQQLWQNNFAAKVQCGGIAFFGFPFQQFIGLPGRGYLESWGFHCSEEEKWCLKSNGICFFEK